MKYRIEEIISSIDWNIVASYLSSGRKLSDKELQGLLEWEKVILKRRINFLINSTMDKLESRNWILRCPGKGIGKNKRAERIKIQFIPISVSASLVDDEVPVIKNNAKNPEWEALYKLMYYYSDQEEYEVCEHIKNRLNEIVEEMRIENDIK